MHQDDSMLPPPLAGEGWGGGLPHAKISVRMDFPHPHRIVDAMRPPPQAGEVESRPREAWKTGTATAKR